MSPRDAAASRVAAFHKGLSDALCTCLGHMGYSQAKARKAASGGCRSGEAGKGEGRCLGFGVSV